MHNTVPGTLEMSVVFRITNSQGNVFAREKGQSEGFSCTTNQGVHTIGSIRDTVELVPQAEW